MNRWVLCFSRKLACVENGNFPTSAAASAGRQHSVNGTSALTETLPQTCPRQEGRRGPFLALKVEKDQGLFDPYFALNRDSGNQIVN
jgi:hypothetical protein